jgi:diguanylate cyclase
MSNAQAQSTTNAARRPHRGADTTLPIAKAALNRIEALSVPADPPNFELWYIYARGLDPSLNAEINALIAAADGLTEEDLDGLHRRHLVSRRSAALLSDTARTLSTEIQDVVGMIGNAVTSSAEFNQHLGAGIADLGKSSDPEDIRRAVESLIHAARAMGERNQTLEKQLGTARKRAEELERNVEVIRLETATDALTRLANRRYFEDAAMRLEAIAKRQSTPLTLLMADVDHFKRINDTFGHPTGDQVLRVVAMTIKACLRDEDVAARYGGEEFAVILPHTDLADAMTVAERIRTSVGGRELTKRSTNESLGRVSISLGLAQLRPNETMTDLIERADKCLYVAKRSGRDRVICDDWETRTDANFNHANCAAG